MKNVTITLDEATALLARREAARQNVSLSRYVGDLLRDRLRQSRRYELSMRRYLALEPVRLGRGDEPYLSREASHDRTGLR